MAGLALAAALSGCAASVKPAELPRPTQISCFNVPMALTAIEKKGLLGNEWKTRIERGPYVSERTDAGGTYYRAPPGGVFYGFADGSAMPSNFHATYGVHDGGIYVPRDPAVPPHLYTYYSVAEAAAVVPPDNADCAYVGLAIDPVTKGVNPAAWAAAGAIGGAQGALAGRAAAPPPPRGMHYAGYGSSAAGGAIGGIIAGLILAEMTNADIGNIRAEPELNDPQMIADIKRFAGTARSLDLPPAAAPTQTAAAFPVVPPAPEPVVTAPIPLAPAVPARLEAPPPLPAVTPPVPLEKPLEPAPAVAVAAPPAEAPKTVAVAPAPPVVPPPPQVATLAVPAATPITRQASASTHVPYLADEKQRKFLEYLSKPLPRAFAISDNGHFASIWGNEAGGNGAAADVKARALEGCRTAAGRDCVLFAVDDTVVFAGAPYGLE